MGAVPVSPCTGQCRLDQQGARCAGCLRTMDEIIRWAAMDDAERRMIMADLPGRRAV